MATDRYQGHDYLGLDDMFTDEHLLIRDTVRSWIKKEVSPIIEDYAQRSEFPSQIVKGLGEIGAFGPYIPEEYGGPGLDHLTAPPRRTDCA